VIRRLLVLAAAIVLATAAPAHAQYGTSQTVTVSSSAIAGGTIKISLGNFPPGTPVTIRVLPSGTVEIQTWAGGAPTTTPTTTPTTKKTATTKKKSTTTTDDMKLMSVDGDSGAGAKVLGKVETDGNGNGSAELPVPADLDLGKATVLAESITNDGVIKAARTETAVKPLVAAAAAPAAAADPSTAVEAASETASAAAAAAPAAAPVTTPVVARLPVTGSSSSVPLGAAGAACVATGGLVLVASRKRRHRELT
jgi:LPXTG-motif cell wall-anchored protein